MQIREINFFKKMLYAWKKLSLYWRVLILSLCSLFLCFCLGVSFLYFRASSLQDSSLVYIEKGTATGQISSLLQEKKIIDQPLLFLIVTRLMSFTRNIHAGEYLIPAHASVHEVIRILTSGKYYERRFTVPEGQTSWQIFRRLQMNEFLSGDLPQTLPREGSLMTDTIQYVRGTSRARIVNILLEGQKKRIQSIWDHRDADLPIKTMEEFVTMASIVEKETGMANERARVAAVFMNRLKYHMRLQSDATVLYGLFGGKGRPENRPIYRSDLQNKNLYNTYVIFGLPPGPIANPGADSLQAVAHPMKTKDLYFVADGTGGHVFSATLAEHNENVKKWRKIKTAIQKIENIPLPAGKENLENLPPDVQAVVE